MFYVYIIKSKKYGRHYIGHSESVENRLLRHNRGAVKSTRNGRPWELPFTEIHLTRAAAYRREMEIKKYKGGIQFKALLARSEHGRVA